MLMDFLHANNNVFMWKLSNMPGILRKVTEHALRTNPGSKPVQQHLRRFNKQKHRAIGEEIAKLLVTGFVKEVYHPKWLANPILVKKKSGK
jgi:hypothetical protein